jgi:hypothetical protein
MLAFPRKQGTLFSNLLQMLDDTLGDLGGINNENLQEFYHKT